MKNELFSTKTLAGAVGTAAIGVAMSTSPVFASADLNQGYQQGGQSPLMLAEGSCGEGTCGDASDTKDSEGSCGEGADGGSDGDEKDSEGACGEGTCGG
ncbi:hypothetical protein TVD_08015 [Thioalkalivibrio versutus]|uniref:Low-complexity protein n=1 Tax=Thioalkalivibrio versutus TaxID=106634 RepID=A0A0G3G267_9GAMM|nr:hypothetical protein [Thioalkalivibrio versutus]AKJ95308.1 hypothetical protein TVD_08015 [Thioalkalivibrio versutus]